MKPEAKGANPMPTKPQCRKAKARIMAAISYLVKEKIDYAFLWADEDDEYHPSWRDLEEIRDEICLPVRDALENKLGDQVQAILERELSLKPIKTAPDDSVDISECLVNPPSRVIP
jgi:hypothetical protein